jgi:hypothetical protein
MGDVEDGEVHQFRPGVAQILAEGWIDLQQTAVRKGSGHPGSGMLENGTKSFHALLLNTGQVCFRKPGSELDHIPSQFFSIGGAWNFRIVTVVRPSVEALPGEGKPPLCFFRLKKTKEPAFLPKTSP